MSDPPIYQPIYQPRVIVKFRDNLQVPYQDDIGSYLDQQGIGWTALTKQFPGIAIERLFIASSSEQILTLVGQAQQMDKSYHPPNFLTYFAIDCPRQDEANDVGQHPPSLIATPRDFVVIGGPGGPIVTGGPGGPVVTGGPGGNGGNNDDHDHDHDHEGDVDPRKVVQALSAWRVVQFAYVEGKPAPPPASVPLANPCSGSQDYLNAAPEGIDAWYGWKQKIAGADGAGMHFVDIEKGWTFPHRDLPQSIPLVAGGENFEEQGHGTAVLGVLVATNEDQSDMGIAPRAQANVVSQFRFAPPTNTAYPIRRNGIADAIFSALNVLFPGDVLLLEVQTVDPSAKQIGDDTSVLLPVEVEPAIFDTIRLATAVGIVVVEAAGNSGHDLDMFTDKNKKFILNRNNAADFQDSGAIMVGAATSQVNNDKAKHAKGQDDIDPKDKDTIKTNFGSRIDCYAWGENIHTTGSSSKYRKPTFDDCTDNFSGTSGASAIVAGAALVAQAVAQAHQLPRYSSPALRDLLKTHGTPALVRVPVNGTPTLVATSNVIGVMPDLQAIINHILSLNPIT